MKTMKNMRVIKLKEWDVGDTSLVFRNKFTDSGMRCYWDTIDSAFKFNSEKNDLFKAKQLSMSHNAKTQVGNDTHKKIETSRSSAPGHGCDRDEMHNFFAKHNDKYHWRDDSYEDRRQKSSFNRFLLPRSYKH